MDYSRSMPDFTCSCGNVLNVATANEDKSPDPEDVILCCYCGELYQFDKKLKLSTVEVDKVIHKIDPSERKDFLKFREQVKKDYKARMN